MQTTPTTTEQEEALLAKFGSGRYSAFTIEVFKDSQVVFELSEEKAETLAKCIVTEVGAFFAKAPAHIKVGKLNKDGKVTLAETVAKLKGVTCTNAILALRALQYANEAIKNGFSRRDTKWEPVPVLKQYLSQL